MSDRDTAVFEQAVGYALANLDLVDDAGLDRATPCPDWDLRRLVLHLADCADAFATLIRTGELKLPEPPRTDDPAPVSVARERIGRLDEAFGAATDPDRTTLAAQVAAIEFAAHGWDVARACGADRPVPEELATALVELTGALITDDGRGTNFAAATQVPVEATGGDRLVAFLGRNP